MSLAYNFDKALISKIGMQALKLYVNIQNLKTWKHNTGYTPELGGSAIASGWTTAVIRCRRFIRSDLI